MGFINLKKCESVSPLPGIRLKAPFGERIMLSHLEMDAGAEVPRHCHPHEQAGVLLVGRLQLTIGAETRTLNPGDVYLVPGGVEHSAVAVDGPVKVLDIFSPIREDYARPSNNALVPAGKGG
ncbi:MAG: cupin domain-containing protein [Pirellulaceae bacterium]